jgi:endoglucanase
MSNRPFAAALLLTAAAVTLACSQGGSEREEPLVVQTISGTPDPAAAVQPTTPALPPMPSPEELAGTPVDRHGQLRFEGTELVDESGVPLQLSGPSSMWLNWETSGFASNRDLVTLFRDSWGTTLMRAAMGVEPGGAYLSNPSAAERDVRAVIDNAINLGLYVIVDWHDHEAQLRTEESVEFFKKMAELYGEYPNVIYEPFNEPLQIDWSSELKPYHDRVVSEIRAIDPDNLIILGTPNWSQYVDDPIADPVEGTNLAYTLHFYSCTHTGWLRDRADRALGAGLPLFVTEWGATHADGGTQDNPGICLDEADVWHDWMNANGISWAAWKLDDCVDESCYFTPGTAAGAPLNEDQLTDHGSYVREKMLAR